MTRTAPSNEVNEKVAIATNYYKRIFAACLAFTIETKI